MNVCKKEALRYLSFVIKSSTTIREGKNLSQQSFIPLDTAQFPIDVTGKYVTACTWSFTLKLYLNFTFLSFQCSVAYLYLWVIIKLVFKYESFVSHLVQVPVLVSYFCSWLSLFLAIFYYSWLSKQIFSYTMKFTIIS